MKQYFILLLVILPVAGFGQEIKLNELDVFTNERIIQTTIVTLKQGFTKGFGVSYTAINKNYYLNVIGYGKGNSIIKADDRLWFVLNDGSVVKFDSRVELDYNESEFQNIYIQHYYINLDDVETLQNTPLAMVRIVSPAGNLDIAVSKKNGKSLAKLSEVFIEEVSK